jgi:hypothetical protein
VAYAKVIRIRGRPEESQEMCDIALGLQEQGLQEFAVSVNAAHMAQWKKLGLYDEEEESWGHAFEQALTKTLAVGGRFHFNLTGLNIADALNGDPEIWVHGHTAWERIRHRP